MVDTFTVNHPAIDRLKQQIDEVGLRVLTGYTLADAIREGCGVTEKSEGAWGNEGNACALSTAFIAARARGYLA